MSTKFFHIFSEFFPQDFSYFFHTFSHLFALFCAFSHFFRIFPPGLLLLFPHFFTLFQNLPPRTSLKAFFQENRKKKTKPGCTLQSGSKTCHSTKKFPRLNFPKYVISVSTRKLTGIIFLFQLGDVNWTIFGDIPLGFVVGCPSIFWR